RYGVSAGYRFAGNPAASGRPRLRSGRLRPGAYDAAAGARRPDLDPTVADGTEDCLNAVVHLQLPQHRRHVVLHRLLGDEQRFGDLLVREALRYAVEHLDLTDRQGQPLRVGRWPCL